MNEHIGRPLIGLKQIMEYIKIKSEETFKKYLDDGFPAQKYHGRWIAHTDNIDNFIKKKTKSA